MAALFLLIELDFTTKSFVSLNTWKDGIMHPKQDMKKSCLTVSMPTAIMEKKKIIKGNNLGILLSLSLPAAPSAFYSTQMDHSH